jgi:deltex-like protein
MEIDYEEPYNNFKGKLNNQDIEETQDMEYLEFTENSRQYITNNMYIEKPTYFKKSLYINSPALSKINKIAKCISVSPIELFYKIKYEDFNQSSQGDEKCTICLEKIYEITASDNFDDILALNESQGYQFKAVMLDKCFDHFFHQDCLADMIGDKKFIKCPICMRLYGIQTGDMPPGSMKAYIDKTIKCSGHESYNTIVIKYKFSNGNNYSGTSRTAYLPDSPIGMKILGMLKVCFDRRLTFTVGTSVTSGKTNTTVWSGIHHKTHTSGGNLMFKYRY